MNALPRFSEARSLVPSKHNATKDIREIIKKALDDDDFFDKITPYLVPEGVAGNRQMDQGLVAGMFFEKAPQLERYANLRHKLLWDHIAFVLRAYGYEFSSGRVIGYKILEDKTKVEHKPQDFAAPKSVPLPNSLKAT